MVKVLLSQVVKMVAVVVTVAAETISVAAATTAVVLAAVFAELEISIVAEVKSFNCSGDGSGQTGDGDRNIIIISIFYIIFASVACMIM